MLSLFIFSALRPYFIQLDGVPRHWERKGLILQRPDSCHCCPLDGPPRASLLSPKALAPGMPSAAVSTSHASPPGTTNHGPGAIHWRKVVLFSQFKAVLGMGRFWEECGTNTDGPAKRNAFVAVVVATAVCGQVRSNFSVIGV